MINFVNRVARTGGRRIDKSNPKIDARMRRVRGRAMASRLHAIMEPLTVNVPIALTIRRHRLIARTIDDLMRLGTITPSAGEFLRLAVEGRLNIVVAGGTASGKSNFVNALGNAVGDGEQRGEQEAGGGMQDAGCKISGALTSCILLLVSCIFYFRPQLLRTSGWSLN